MVVRRGTVRKNYWVKFVRVWKESNPKETECQIIMENLCFLVSKVVNRIHFLF